jgi:hypothetical protein
VKLTTPNKRQGQEYVDLYIGFPFRRPLRLPVLRWRYSNPPPHGNSLIHTCVREVELDVTEVAFTAEIWSVCWFVCFRVSDTYVEVVAWARGEGQTLNLYQLYWLLSLDVLCISYPIAFLWPKERWAVIRLTCSACCRSSYPGVKLVIRVLRQYLHKNAGLVP